MKKNINLILTAACLAFALSSCQKTSITELNQATTAPQPKTDNGEILIGGKEPGEECTPTTVSLMAGQHINVGSVSVTNDAEYIYVTYTTTGNWVLSQTHLYVGACHLIPVNNSGNPRIGHFPYRSGHANLNTYTYRVPATAIINCGCIAAHAVVKKLNGSGNVVQTETAWGNGTQITPGGSWAMKFAYCACIGGN